MSWTRSRLSYDVSTKDPGRVENLRLSGATESYSDARNLRLHMFLWLNELTTTRAAILVELFGDVSIDNNNNTLTAMDIQT